MKQETGKVWTPDTVIDLLGRSDAAVVEAIKGLYARQTEVEQASKETTARNGRGFNYQDAPFFSDIAKALPRYNDHMTPRQLAKARHMLRKYSRQLLEIIEEKGGRVEFAKPRNSEPALPSVATAAAPIAPAFDDDIDGTF